MQTKLDYIMTYSAGQNALDLITKYEGLKIKAYVDPATGGEPITIGIGTTRYHDGVKVKLGDNITEDEAKFELQYYVDHQITDKLDPIISIDINQDQIDAIVVLCYNIGFPSFSKSTLLRKINAGDFEGAQAEFLKWNRANNKTMRGLTRRRLEEATLFGPLDRQTLIDTYLNGKDPDIA